MVCTWVRRRAQARALLAQRNATTSPSVRSREPVGRVAVSPCRVWLPHDYVSFVARRARWKSNEFRPMGSNYYETMLPISLRYEYAERITCSCSRDAALFHVCLRACMGPAAAPRGGLR